MSTAIAFLLQGEIWHLLAQTGLVARIVLFILFGFSVFSWAIILKKSRAFRTARRDSHEFLRIFRQSKKLSDIRASCQALRQSPLVEVFLAGYREIETQAVPSENPGKMRIKSLVSIQRSLHIATSGELTRLEKWLSWPAATRSAQAGRKVAGRSRSWPAGPAIFRAESTRPMWRFAGSAGWRPGS